MCGIAAILSSSDRWTPDLETIGRMNKSQIHRGPDGSGAKLFAGRSARVGLGHRRLSIIDLEGGGQPMSNEDGTVWISYNGEIYNHQELRTELLARGHRYRSRCDTETILHAYEEWGEECVLRLRGMFAFVIWDSQQECLFAARDRLGIKPLYYSQQEGTFVCASEIKALFASGWRTADLHVEALPEKLTLGYLAEDATLFRGIHKLLPGHRLRWQQGVVRCEPYWEVPLPAASPPPLKESELVEQFLHLFREAVRMRLMSDVPLGVFLSGGLDSSAIAAIMAESMTEPLKTFSVGFESQYYSEFDFAREVAASIGADHHEVVLRPAQMFARLPKLIWHEEEPIRNPSSVALAEVSELAASAVKVVLTGEGSDELFGGYERYWATRINLGWGAAYHRLVPSALHDRWLRPALQSWVVPLPVRKKLSHTFLNYSLRPEEIIFENWHAVFSPRHYAQLFTDDAWQAVKHVDPFAATMRLYDGRLSHNLVDRMLYTDQKAYLVELLRKQDTMSMSASIESRVPFLDHHLVEFAAQLPSKYKIRGCAGKYLVKRAMRHLLPSSIIRRKKMGFPVPINRWFQESSAGVLRHILTSRQLKEHGIFREKHLLRLLDEHLAGAQDHADALWTVLNFELWTRIYIDHEDAGALADELTAQTRPVRRPSVAEVA